MATVRAATENDADRVFDLSRQAFNMPAAMRERARTEFRPENVRVVEHAGRIVASLRLHRFAHFWGGRPVSAAGVGGVAVAAESRGKGYASLLMQETLRELRRAGTLISSLYPATVPVYRSCGYGFGAVRTLWKTDLALLPPRSRDDVEIVEFDDPEDVTACYDRVASAVDGMLGRDRTWWNDRVVRSMWEEGDPYRYAVRQDGSVTGYIIYRLERSKDDWRASLGCRDLMWTTPEAGRALLALAAMHRSTGLRLGWVGPPTEPLADLMTEEHPEVDFRIRLMVRLLDVAGAIEARGYAPHVQAAVTLQVEDGLLGDNAGPWRVEVAEGRAKVLPAETAEATADASTWASIWSGLHPPVDAARLGGLRATTDAMQGLRSIFAGPTPWLADFY